MSSAGQTSLTPSAGPRWLSVPCFMCTNQCGLRVCVEDNKVTKIEGWSGHPRSQGKICIKARQIPDYLTHKDRLKYPVKKTKGGWQRISWDEALDTIATRWLEAKEKYGPASGGVFLGEPGCFQVETSWHMAWRFCDVYGTPNRFDPADLCGFSTWMGQIATVGYMIEPDVDNSDCVVIWATNPSESDHVVASKALAAQKKGGKLVVIDPRRIPLAKRADMHITPNPGTDAYMALAAINIIIQEELYDKEFVNNYTVGFDKLKEHVKSYTAEEAERICGVPAEQVKAFARLFATSKSACIRTYFRLSFQVNGFQNYRILSILSAITGNIDVPGGELQFGYSTGMKPTKSVRLPELMGDVKCVGVEKYPLYAKVFPGFKEGSMVNWGDLVLNEPQVLRNLLVVGSNPAVTWPNTPKVRKALSKLDFLAVMDVVMTPTTELAQIVVPATTMFEKPNFTTYHGEFMGRPVVPPYGEAKSECQFWCELGRRMGYEQYFPWKNDEEAFNYFYEPVTIKSILEQHPDGFMNYNMMPGERRYRKEGFPTATGKCELYSEMLEQLGIAPLPSFLEPTESPRKTPEVFNDYPVFLNTGHRDVEWWHSMFRHLDGLRRRMPEPLAEIHPETAAKYGVVDGELMNIETTMGNINMRAKVTEDIKPNVVSIPHGWHDPLYNVLTDDHRLDPVSGFPELTGWLCRVRATNGKASS
ncbi:MAG: molybdopterin-dependent oxidoreductase [Terriglobales bacterium]